MRLRSLRLLRWGQLSGRSVTLPDGAGLDILVGPNEAGKTTTMRAFRSLLSGIRPSDPAPVPVKDAELEAEVHVGGEDRVVKRLGRRETGTALLDAGHREIAPSGWPRLSRTVYDAVFCLDHHELDASGRALARSGADLGELFFATNVGLEVYVAARKSLGESLERRFSSHRGAKQKPVNAAVLALQKAQSTLDAQRVDSTAWARLEKGVDDATETRERLRRAREEAGAAHEAQVRAVEALPRVRALQAARARLSELDPDGTLPDLAWARDVRSRLEAHEGALREVARLEHDLGETVARRDAIPDDAEILAAGDVLDALAPSLGWVRAAMEGLPAHERAMHAAQDAIRARVEASGRTLDVRDAEAVRAWHAQLPDPEAIAQAREALDALSLRSGHAAQAASDEEDARTALERCAQTPGDAGQVDGSSLAVALEGARPFRGVRLADARAALAARVAELDAEARGMGLVDADVLRLLGQRHPDDTEIQAELDAAAAAARTRDENERAAQDVVRDMERCARDAEVIRAAGTFVELASLHDARRHRDAGVAAALEALDGTVAPLRVWAGNGDAAGAVREAVRQADAMADARFDHAESASRLVELDRRVAQGRARLAALEAAGAALDAAVIAREEAWRTRLADLAVPWQPAAALRSWVASLQRLRDRALVLARESEERAAREAEVSDAHVALARALGDTDARDVSLDARVARAEQVLAVLREAREARVQAAGLLRDAERRRERAEATRVTAQAAWDTAATAVGLPADVPEAVARQRLRALEELRVLSNDWAQASRDVTGASDVLGAFRARLASLAGLVDPALPPLVQAERLLARRVSATEQRVARMNLTERIDLLARERDSHAARVTACGAALAEARRRVGLAPEESLEPLIVAVEEAHALREQVQVLARDLGGRAAALEVLLEGRTAAELESAVAAARQRRDEVEAAFQDAVGAVVAAEKDRAQVDGSLAAARAAEARAACGAELSAQLQEYLEEAVAAWILDQAIADAQTHAEDGPLVRASAHFRTLTLGAFEGLRALDASSSGTTERYVVAVRDGLDTVGIDALSDGTRDALWLALRIAAIEEHLDREGPVPVVLDDVLVHLDDARAAAALFVLAELSGRTQVLLFTHHAHLAVLASKVLGARARIQELAPRDPSVMVPGSELAPPALSASAEPRKGKPARR
jgi:chromosome segregation protein